jgi:hypothetical protein
MKENRSEFLAGVIAAPAVASAAVATATCRILNAAGEPLPAVEAGRLQLCDLMLRPFPGAPAETSGEVRFQPPDQPFRIGVRMTVPGFGNVTAYSLFSESGYRGAL